jgi:transcriptional regulator with XRE-family HTH domain
MKDRINKILQHENLSSSKFADLIGVQRSSVSHILSGRNNPGLDFLNKILGQFPNISGDWLITGQGSMLKKNNVANISNQSLFDPKPTNINPSANINESITEKKAFKGLFQTEKTPEPTPVQSVQPITSNHGNIAANADTNKLVERIIVFYSDRSFREYLPE